MGGPNGGSALAALADPLPLRPGPTRDSQSATPDPSVKGIVGTPNWAGWLQDLGEYNSKLAPPTAFLTYEKMRRSDGDIAAVLAACTLPIRAAEYQVVPNIDKNEPGYAKAKEIADFVKENLFGGLEMQVSGGSRESAVGSRRKVSQSFESVVENALLMLAFGCAAHEPVYAVDGGMIRIARFAPRLPSTFYKFTLGEDGETLAALEQQGFSGTGFATATLEADRLDFFTFQREGANWWGRSILRTSYKHWYVKEQLERIDAIACERNGLGVAEIDQADNASKEDRAAAEEWVKNLSTHERTGLVLPFAWAFHLKAVEGRPREILPSIRYHSEMIVRSALATFLAFGTTQTGARSLGESATDFFKLSLQATADLIAETMTQGSIRRLVDFNFAPADKTLYPRLVFANILATLPTDLWKTVKELTDGGVIQADDDLEAAAREDLGLPVKGEARIQPQPVPAAGVGSGESGVGTGVIPAQAGNQPGNQKVTGKGQSAAKQEGNLSDTRHPTLDSLHAADGGSRASQRQLKQWEQKVDYAALRRRQDATAKKVARLLRAVKPATARQAAQMISGMHVTQMQSLALPTNHAVIAQIEQGVTPAFQYGRTSVLRERYRATGRRGAATRNSRLGTRQGECPEPRAPSPESRTLLADRLARSKNAPRLVAEATWADFANWISPRAIAAAVDGSKRGLEGGALEDAVNAAFDDMADGGLDKIGMEAGRGAVAGGRYGTLADFDAEISRYIRTEADDDRTCEVCDAADGIEWESLDEIDWQPGDDCLGGDLCRGQIVAVFADEGTVVEMTEPYDDRRPRNYDLSRFGEIDEGLRTGRLIIKRNPWGRDRRESDRGKKSRRLSSGPADEGKVTAG